MATFQPRSGKASSSIARKLAPVFSEVSVIELDRKFSGSFETFGTIAIDHGEPAKGKGAAAKPGRVGDTIDDVTAEIDRVISEHAEENGRGTYQITAKGDRNVGRKIEHDAVIVKFTFVAGDGREVDDDGSSAGILRETSKMIAQQNATTLAFLERAEKMNGELSTRLLAAQDSVAKASEVQVKLLEVQINAQTQERREQREDAQAAAENERYREAIAFGKQLLAQFIAYQQAKKNGEASATPPTTSAIALEIRALIDSCQEPEIAALKDALGEDAWSVVIAASNAPDDEQAIMILRKLQATFKSLTEEKATEIMTRITITLGPARATQLMAIIERAK